MKKKFFSVNFSTEEERKNLFMSQKFLWPRKHEISCSLLKRSETNKKGSFHRDKKIEFSPVSKFMLFVLALSTMFG